jgi:hypothetical protein
MVSRGISIYFGKRETWMTRYKLVCFTFFCLTTELSADNIINRDAVNTTDNHPNYYTNVKNVLSFTQIIKTLAKISSKTVVSASLNLCIEIKNAITQIMKNTTSQLVNTTVQTVQNAYKDIKDPAINFVWEYKWRLVGASATSGYLYLLYTMVTLRLYFNHAERWFNWNEYLSLDALCARPQDALGIDLVKEVQRRYTSISTPTDFVSPLIKFLMVIDEEEKALALYLRLGPWIERLHLCTLTGYSKELAQQCAVWRRRVGYLRATFMRWMADYKLEQNTAVRSILDQRFPFLQFIAKRQAHQYLQFYLSDN